MTVWGACGALLVIFIMADYAAEIEVWSDRKTKCEVITNYDVVQDYLANDTYPKERQKQWNMFQENGEEVDGVLHYNESFSTD